MTVSFSPFPCLESSRLYLRRLEERDAEGILGLRSDDRVNEFIDRKKMTSLDSALDFIGRIDKHIDNDESIFWAVIDKANNELVGTVCLWNIDKEEEKAEIGYELLWDRQGNGFMMEALPLVIEFGFKKMGLKMIEAVIKPVNGRSIKLAEKLGFVFLKEEEGLVFYGLTFP